MYVRQQLQPVAKMLHKEATRVVWNRRHSGPGATKLKMCLGPAGDALCGLQGSQRARMKGHEIGSLQLKYVVSTVILQ